MLRRLCFSFLAQRSPNSWKFWSDIGLESPFGSNETIRGGPLGSFRMKAGKPGRPGSIKSLGFASCPHAL